MSALYKSRSRISKETLDHLDRGVFCLLILVLSGAAMYECWHASFGP
jgi:hypothetical protein